MSNKKAKGIRAKTRHKMRNRATRLAVDKMLQEFAVGAGVQVRINSSVHSGIPHRRYQGMTGTIVGKRGRAFEVDVLEGNKRHVLVVNSAHLCPFGQPEQREVAA